VVRQRQVRQRSGGAALCKECDAATANSFTLDTVTKGSKRKFAAECRKARYGPGITIIANGMTSSLLI